MLNQDVENYEIILVNDGSTDNSAKICKNYAKKESRVRYFDKENGGLSDARNYGIGKAIGKYITFVDSDDFVVKDSYPKLLKEALRYDLDIITGNKLKYISEEQIFTTLNKRNNMLGIYEGELFLVDSVKNDTMSMSAVISLYKKKLILTKELYFKKGILHEDELWTPQVFLKANKAKYIDLDFYMHCQREGSITQRLDKTNNAIDLIKIAYELDEIYSQINNKQHRKILKDYLVMLYLNAFYVGKLYRKEYKHLLNKKFVIKNACTIRNKLKAILFFIDEKLYYNINKKLKSKF